MLFSAELCVALDDEVLLKEKKKSSNLKKKITP